jgi:hypothetical protein
MKNEILDTFKNIFNFLRQVGKSAHFESGANMPKCYPQKKL